jgi:DNA-binding PadR family transcriptional regulator
VQNNHQTSDGASFFAVGGKRGQECQNKMHEEKDRELLLLGIIRSGDIHVYELNKFIAAHSTGVINAEEIDDLQRFLRRMEKDGWIDSYEQQVRQSSPAPGVPDPQPDGEAQFQQLLRERGGTFVIPELMGAISLGFLHELPLEEAAQTAAAPAEFGGGDSRPVRPGSCTAAK